MFSWDKEIEQSISSDTMRRVYTLTNLLNLKEQDTPRNITDLIRSSLDISGPPTPFVAPKVLTITSHVENVLTTAEGETIIYRQRMNYPPNDTVLDGKVKPVQYTLHALIQFRPPPSASIIGYYISFIKQHKEKNGEWWMFDDSKVVRRMNLKRDVSMKSVRRTFYHSHLKPK